MAGFTCPIAFCVDDRLKVGCFHAGQSKTNQIKNIKTGCWHLELASFSYAIKFRPGSDNVAADAFLCTICTLVNIFTPQELRKNLCQSDVRRLAHYVCARYLSFSVENVKRACSSCRVCAELKLRFYILQKSTLIKATQPFERIASDCKGPLPCIQNMYCNCR